MPDIITSFSQHQPAYIAQSGDKWAVTYPVQPHEDAVTGHASALGEFLSSHHTTAFLSVKESAFLFIPDELFDEKHQPEYGRLMFAHPGEILRYIPWPECNCTYLYSAKEAPAYGQTLHTYPQAWVMHRALAGMYDDAAASHYAILHDDEVLLFLYHQNRLQFYNRFSFENYDELAYYVLQSVKQSDASTEKPLKLIAEGYGAGRAHENLNRFLYTEHISTGRLPILNELNLLEEITLFGLQQCALSVAG